MIQQKNISSSIKIIHRTISFSKKGINNVQTKPEMKIPTNCFILPTTTSQKNKGSTTLFIKVYVKPGSKKNNILLIDPNIDEMNVNVAAPPIDGEANQELCEYIASILKVRKSQVSVHAGHKSRKKILAIHDVLADFDIKGNEKRLEELYERLLSNKIGT
jgi:uncharacterized protein (TIGR00251 family)